MAGVYTGRVSSIVRVASFGLSSRYVFSAGGFSLICRAAHNEIGAGRLTERASSCVGGSRGLDRVERRLRAEAANIPLNGIKEDTWGV